AFPRMDRRSTCNHPHHVNPSRRGPTKANGAAYAAPPTTKGLRRTTALRPLTPTRQILFLLRRQLVDFDSHGLKLQLRHSLVQVIGHAVNLLLERLMVLHHVVD